MENLKDLGHACQLLRELLGASQVDVARETGYSKETVSAFETGRNNNARVLLWYVRHGFRVVDNQYFIVDRSSGMKTVNLTDANDPDYLKMLRALAESRQRQVT